LPEPFDEGEKAMPTSRSSGSYSQPVITSELHRRRKRYRAIAIVVGLVGGLVLAGAMVLATANRADGLGEVTQISVGFEHACALRTDASVHCWGRNASGAFGAGVIARPEDPAGMRTKRVSLDARAVSLSSGARHVCALLDNETVRCWGAGGDGQLGVNTIMDRSLPISVGLRRVVAISAGVGHTCAVHDKGRVSCWGLNDHGQTGSGQQRNPAAAVGNALGEIALDDEEFAGNAFENDLRPMPVEGPRHAIQVSTGYFHSCALERDGTVMCWGTNGQDQLGEVDVAGSIVALPVPNLSNVTQIDGGTWNTCARTKTSEVFCWGVDFFSTGEIGPIRVKGLPPVTSVSVGSTHACALANDQTVWCWGKNDSGQLGNGTIEDSRVAHQVRELNNVTSVSVGSQNSCAVTSNREPYCWGENLRFAVVGAPTRLPISVIPVRVVGYTLKPERPPNKFLSRLKNLF
jgi:alpha-tubulin suppressor-like RCC1 family protein